MADETKKPSGSEAATAARHEELAPQLWMMITTFFHSPGRNTLFSLGAAVMINDHGTNQPPGFRDEECSP